MASQGGKMLLLLRQKKVERRIRYPDAKMDMTPMIDVVFLLIIFFMLVMELTKVEVESITLPFATKAKEDKNPPPGRVIVNIKARPGSREHGSIWVHHRRYDAARFRDMLHRLSIRNRDADNLATISVKIRGDANVEWKHVQKVLVACMREMVWQCSFGAMPSDKLQY